MPPGINSSINNPQQQVRPRREHRTFEVPDVTSEQPPQRGFVGAPPQYGDMQGSELYQQPQYQQAQGQPVNPYREEHDRQRRQQEMVNRSEETARIEAEMSALRRQKTSGNIPISSFGRERMEYLAGLGRIKKDVTVQGGDHPTVFSLRTLKAREMREAVRAVTNVPKLEIVFEARRQELAYAIYRIDGVPIDQVLGTEDFEARLEWVEDLDLSLQKYLHAELGAMDNQARDNFAIKTDAQLKEVIEDAKK